MKILRFARAFVLLVWIPLCTLFFSAVTVLIVAPFTAQRTNDRWIRFWARSVLTFSGARIRVEGLEHLKDLKSSILVSNHLSHFDIPVLYSSIPVPFRMVAKVELFGIPLFGRAIRAMGFVPVMRDSSEVGKKVFLEMESKFKSGQSLWMAPEGTRNSGEAVGEFKLGAFYLALKAGQPIVPICIYGTQKLLRKNSFWINIDAWKTNVEVRVLPPIFISTQDSRSRHDLRDEARARILGEFSRFHTSNGGRDPSKEDESTESSVSQNPM